MVEVTQEDREAAAAYARHACLWPDGVPPHAIQSGHPHGDATKLTQAFAAHRIQSAADTRAKVIEECAGVVEGHRYGDSELDSCLMRREHRNNIAKAIRALGDKP